MCVFIKHNKYSYIKLILLVKYFLNDRNDNNEKMIQLFYPMHNGVGNIIDYFIFNDP